MCMWNYTRLPCNGIHFFHNFKNARLNYAVIHIPSIPTVCDNLNIFQHFEVLGDISLAKLEHGFDVTYTLFPITQDRQNRQPCRMRYDFE